MGKLRVERAYEVRDDRLATTTSGALVDDPYAYLQIELAESRTVLVIYQSHNDYGDPLEFHGRVSGINIDGVDVARSTDSPYEETRTCRCVSVWVGQLGPGTHVIKGRMASEYSGTTTSVRFRILIAIVFAGDSFFYVYRTTAISTSSTAPVPDPHATVSVDTRYGDVVVVLYVATSGLGSYTYYGIGSAVRVGDNYYSISAKAGNATFASKYFPAVTISAYAFRSSGGQVTVGGGVFTAAPGYTVVIDEGQLAVLVLDGQLADIDYLSSDGLFVVGGIWRQPDPGVEIVRRVDGSRAVLLAVANGYKPYDVRITSSVADYGISYGILVDGELKSFTRGSCSPVFAALSSFAACAVELNPGTHVVRGALSANEMYDTALITSRYLLAVWMVYEYQPAADSIWLDDIQVVHPKMPPPGITVDGYVVPVYLDEWGRVRINGVLEDGTIVIAIPAVPPPPPPYREFITANTYPMFYITRPIKAQQLVSKVEGAAVVRVARDYPEVLIKRNRANELRSKF